MSAPNAKRTRTNKTQSKSSRKASVAVGQGSSEICMKVPAEIFAEILSYVNPGDLISLIRSNKFFRKMLLQRSAAHIWRQVESNVPNLPPCPPDMCEPQYAALMFSNYCTLCGAPVTSQPDPNLRVRICASCRNTELKDVTPTSFNDEDIYFDLFPWSGRYKPKGHKDKSSRYSIHIQPMYGLKREVEPVLEKKRELVREGNKLVLEQWLEERRKETSAKREYNKKINEYLGRVDYDQLNKKRDVGQERRRMIQERLKTIGWTEEDMRFSSDRSKPWDKLVNAYRPLTDRAWKGLLPKLVPILEGNRQRNITFATQERRIKRRRCVNDFLSQMRQAHPFQSLFDALGPGHQGFFSPLMENPFPKTKTALKWDLLNDLGEREITIDQVEAELAERKDQIERSILNWRTDIERRLVERFEAGGEKCRDDVVVTVQGSTDATAHLSQDSRILLRADTIFRRRDFPPDPENDLRCQYGVGISRIDNSLQYYPNLISSKSHFFEYPSPDHDDKEDPRDQETNLDNYDRYVKAEQAVKPLLRVLGMPDASWAELKFMNRKFQCGMCTDKHPKTWDELVAHYIKALDAWNDTKDLKGNHHTRHPVIFRNVHDLEPTDDPKPLVRSLSQEEASQLWKASKVQIPAGSHSTQSLCYLCEGTGRKGCRLSVEDMLVHMQDVHGVAEPVEGLHYGVKDLGFVSGKWHKEWDASHDAHVSAPAPVLE
ncbi:hypothetical protein BDV93DRAFT_495506 [Ceratobasidium sp. AG-I]|nr:hypothetical protein BDV93DRAFT_495506 [Ceratobasidium sp. AG-I]